MENQTDKRNIKAGIVLSYIALFVSILGNLFISNRVLNLVGDYSYGLLSLVNSITSWLTIISSAITASYLKFASAEYSQENGDVSRINSLYFRLLLLLGVSILMLGSIAISILFLNKVCIGSYSWQDSENMYLLFAISILNIAISMPTTVYSLYVTFKKKFIFSKILSISITVLTFTGNYLIAFFTKNVIFIAIFSIILTVISWAVTFCFCKTKIGFSFARTSLSKNKALLASIIAFSSFVLFNAVVDQINTNVDKTLLGFFATPFDVTIYQMGQQFSTYLMVMSVSVSSVYAPTIHSLVIDQNKEGIGNLFLDISHVQMIIVCLISFGFFACGKDFVRWWIGDSRINAYYVASILMLMDICPLTINASIEIQRAYNKHKFRAIVYFAFAVVNVCLSILFLNFFNIEYAIFACLLGSVIARLMSHWVLMNIYNHKSIELPVKKYLLVLAKYLLFGILCCAACLTITHFFVSNIEIVLIRFLIEGSMFVLLYGGFVFAFDGKYVVSKLFKKRVNNGN